MPVCLLPMPNASSLLAAWLDLLDGVPSIRNITVVTGRNEDLEAIQAEIDGFQRTEGRTLRATSDRNEHRGTAGTVADTLAGNPDDDHDVLIIEGASLAPDDISPILDEGMDDDD